MGAKQCLCGCGQLVDDSHDYRWGHRPPEPPTLCGCGCGELLPPSRRRGRRFITSHNIRVALPRPPKERLSIGGYVYLHRPDHPAATKRGLVAEHRLVWETHNGRLLDATEVVHHINEITDDNRPENLRAMTIAEHRRLHMTTLLRDEQRQKYSDGTRAAIHAGRRRTDTMKGRKHTPETRALMSLRARERNRRNHR